MAIPDSLARWREFMSERAVEPERLSMKRLQALSPEAKEAYDQQRFAWIGADTVLETKDSSQIEKHLRIVQARGSARSATAKRAFAISGRAGLGKSTTALNLGRKHERARRRTLGDGPDVTPVVYAVVPPGATPKMLMRAFATWLGMQVPQRFDAPTITDQVVRVMTEQQTSLVILDEVHNLRTRRSAGAEAASQLKVFTERLDAAFVCCGIDLLTSDLFTGDIGKQIRARTKMYALEPYSFGSEKDRDNWLTLVLGMEDLLPLSDHPEGLLEDEAAYLFHRTGGSIGSLRGLLGDAAIEAILSGRERVDRALMDEIILDEEAGAPGHYSHDQRPPFQSGGRKEDRVNRPSSLDPLPVPTRLVGGEGVSTYASRHAARNFSKVKDIEDSIREQGYVLSKARSAPERLALWRQLGNLHERAFTEPQTVNGNWVIERRLCDRCMPHLEGGIGRLPWRGWVCLKHKRWVRGEQVDLAGFSEALTAERHWRSSLARRGVVVESPIVRLAEEAAMVGLSKDVRKARAERVADHSPGLLVYPETVALAQVLTRGSFLDVACDPDIPGTQRRALVERKVYRILPDTEAAEAWRAVARVWTMVTDLADLIRDARLVGMTPDDGKYNVLRYSRWLPQPAQGLGRRAEANRDGGAR